VSRRRHFNGRQATLVGGALAAAPGCPACGAPVNALAGDVELAACPNCGQWQRDGDCLHECVARGFASRVVVPGRWLACTACEWHDAGTATGRPSFGWVRVTTRRHEGGPLLDDVTVCGACRDAVVLREQHAAGASVGAVVTVTAIAPPAPTTRCDECEPYQPV